MGPSSDDVIALAQHTKALSKEQLDRILKFAHKMGPEDLEKMKAMLINLQKASMEDMKQELEVRKKVASFHSEWKADKNRAALQTQEGAVQQEDTAQAEALIQNI